MTVGVEHIDKPQSGSGDITLGGLVLLGIGHIQIPQDVAQRDRCPKRVDGGERRDHYGRSGREAMSAAIAVPRNPLDRLGLHRLDEDADAERSIAIARKSADVGSDVH